MHTIDFTNTRIWRYKNLDERPRAKRSGERQHLVELGNRVHIWKTRLAEMLPILPTSMRATVAERRRRRRGQDESPIYFPVALAAASYPLPSRYLVYSDSFAAHCLLPISFVPTLNFSLSVRVGVREDSGSEELFRTFLSILSCNGRRFQWLIRPGM